MKKEDLFGKRTKKEGLEIEEEDIRNIPEECLYIVGLELKHLRMAQAKTLYEYDCSCSLSYASKVENGKILPKYTILREMCASNGISKEELHTLLHMDDQIAAAIECLFKKDYAFLETIYRDVKEFSNYKVDFIKMLYELRYKHYNKVQELYDSLIAIEENLKGRDLEILVYVGIELELHKGNYPKASKIAKKMSKYENRYLDAFISYDLAYAICKMRFENPVPYYEKCLRKYCDLYCFDLGELSVLYLDTLIDLHYELTEAQMSLSSKDSLLRYYLIHEDYESVKKWMEKNKASTYQKVLINLALHNDKECEDNYKELDFHNMTDEEIVIANFCYFILKGNPEKISEYLYDVAIPFAKNHYCINLFTYFLNYYAEISLNIGKYKNVAILVRGLFDLLSDSRLCLQ